MGLGINAINKVAKSKIFTKLNQPTIAGSAATIALVSTMSKDIVATYYYVTQSAKNKKIPPEKRSFVAALDLGNGIMNVVTAIAIGYPMKGWIDKLFNSTIVKKYFSDDLAKDIMEKAIKAGKEIDEKQFFEVFAKRKELAKTGLGVIGTLVGSQILGKRIITPLVSTPMASVFEKLFKPKEGKEDKELTSEEKIAIVNSAMPMADKMSTLLDMNKFIEATRAQK